MAADAFITHDRWIQEMDGTEVNLTTDTFKIALYDDNETPAPDSDTVYDTTNELATANGYTQGGITLTGNSWTQDSAGVYTLDFSGTVQWTASGGSISALYAKIYDDTTANKYIVASSKLDSGGTEVVATDTNTFTIDLSAGVYTVTRS